MADSEQDSKQRCAVEVNYSTRPEFLFRSSPLWVLCTLVAIEVSLAAYGWIRSSSLLFVAILAFLCNMATWSDDEFLVDRSRGVLIIRRLCAWKVVSTDEFDLSKIARFEIESNPINSADGRFVAIQKDGQTLPLDNFHSEGGWSQASLEKLNALLR